MDQIKIDSLIAEKIMKWKVYNYENTGTCEAEDEEGNIVIIGKEFSPLSSIQDAWKVVSILSVDYGVKVYEDLGAPCECSLHHFSEEPTFFSEADTVPIAVCLAALKTVGIDAEHLLNTR
ncbi:hypothetical protein LCM23_13005 [Cytobacillus kochii]|uniref:BC1872 family protein n=1 Tax=Cytobacillus kochii TaxID=859143 RepID=UPI001CD7BFB7|nr:hypothetical protein [Cytobacillus kochii]MCA1027013.1 hypothetical protein [Cytobacillus kochii]